MVPPADKTSLWSYARVSSASNGSLHRQHRQPPQRQCSGGDTNGANTRSTSYSANSLNQYSSIGNPGFQQILGLAYATNAVTVNSVSTDRRIEYFRAELPINNTSPLWTNVNVVCAGVTNSGGLIVPKASQSPTYDLDGNLTSDGIWTYDWDGENRLIAMTMTNIVNVPNSGRLRLEYGYDFMNRRVSKTVKTWNGSAFASPVTTYFVYDNWNLIAILSASSTLQSSFAWGQDLSGTMDKAGGIGGLILTSLYGSSITNCFTAFGVGGNVAAEINATDGSIATRYDFGPFGERLRATGYAAHSNPFQFSTKFQDEETGLIYYGCRYYSPALGRWTSHDPSGEVGGLNLQCFALNCPITTVDSLGESNVYAEVVCGNIQDDLRHALAKDRKIGDSAWGVHGYTYLLMFRWFHAGGTYDYKANDSPALGNSTNKYYIGTREVKKDQMGNYLAGYAAAYASMIADDPVFVPTVEGFGDYYSGQEAWRNKKSLVRFAIDYYGSISMRQEGYLDGLWDAITGP
jgi:RHS repeat-associated protein